MSEEVAGTETAAATQTDTATSTAGGASVSPSAGTLLRQAREAAGVDLASLATALKVSVKKLEALEDDRHDLLPDAVFMRGLAAGVCRVLKVDATAVLAQLPQSGVPRLELDQPGLNTPFHMPGDLAKAPFWERLSRPMVMAALAVLMGALVLILFPSKQQRAELGGIVAQAPTSAEAPEPAGVAAAAETEAPPKEEEAAQTAEPSKPQPVQAPEPPKKEAVAAKPVPAKVAAAAAPAPEALASAPAAVAPRKKLASTGIVVFRAHGPSWIEVTDGNGAIQLSRQIDDGDTVGASGPLPLTVTVGRADITEVEVRGKPFPLESVSKNGVARFEVK